jgi:antitoxin (DNA-binding transcriptional repressor) of toxin-antitoxin stability system
MNISIKDPKGLLNELVRRAEAGEHVVLISNGEKIAELGPASAVETEEVTSGSLPRIGALKGKIWIADDFDELGPEWDEYIK